MFVLSDGEQSNRDCSSGAGCLGGAAAATASANEVKAAGVTLYSIGFGDGVELSTLQAMASEPIPKH
eukprot:392839-Prymnesium_polylepis.1